MIDGEVISAEIADEWIEADNRRSALSFFQNSAGPFLAVGQLYSQFWAASGHPVNRQKSAVSDLCLDGRSQVARVADTHGT